MKKKIYYFDHAATTPVKPEVLAEMIPYFTAHYGNPSSIYSLGRDTKEAINTARERVAKGIGAKPNEIYFTGCGTEADNWAIKGVAGAYKDKGRHIITSAIEHHAVLHTCASLEKEGFEITYVNPDSEGIIHPEDVEKAIRPDTILISIMFANNEIGTVQDIASLCKIAHKHDILFHTDAVQATGAIYYNVKDLDVDMLSMSAHKLYGPKGIGALYIKNGVRPDVFMDGGAQERHRRGGTENVAGIAGFGKAMEMAIDGIEEKSCYIATMRDYLIQSIEEKIPYVKLNGHREQRLPNNVNFSFRFIEGESLLLSLDLKGIAASSGSACTSGSLDPSHVLLAIGLPHEIAHGSLRLTIGEETTMEQMDYVVSSLVEIVERLRNMSPLYEDFKKTQN
ncbi:MAG: cysteine desulfurase NifS [Clostridia bacterium]|nr:cysteine desulfurase NifS [Clostridia bacterium]